MLCLRMLVLAGLLFVLVLNSINSCFGQTIKDIFPDQDVLPIDLTEGSSLHYHLMAKRNLLGISKEQQQEALGIYRDIAAARNAADKLHRELGNDYRGPKTEDFNRMEWEEFMALLDVEQTLKLTNYLLVRRVYSLSQSKWSHGTDLEMPLQELAFSSALANWLGVSQDQQKRLQVAKRKAETATENLPRDLPIFDPERAEAELFAQWQKTLFEILLPHQQSLFDKALGKEAPFMEQFYGKLIGNFRVFLIAPVHLEKSSRGWGIVDSKKEFNLGQLLNLTHPHLDAKIHPHPLFEFLLNKDVSDHLRLDRQQLDAINRMRADWFENNPAATPEDINIPIEVSYKMTTETMREKEKEFKEKFGHYHDQVDRILTDKQRLRLRQLGNQFLLSRGWREVPLTCPEWIDYLGLSTTQQSEFEDTNDHFRIRHERQEWEIYEPLRKIARDLEDEISQILSDRQKESLLLFKTFIDQ